MPFSHVVVWLDQTEAHVIHFGREAADFDTIKTGSAHPHGHVHGATHPGFYRDVTNAVKDASEILIVGPGLSKTAFHKHLQAHHPDVAGHVVGVEPVDHPRDAQLLSYARHYFLKVDIMR